MDFIALPKLWRVMKLCAVFMLAACLQVSARGFSQITIQANNAPLQYVFTQIEKQSGYTFFYDENLLTAARKIDIRVSNISLEEVLPIVFEGQPLTFSIVGKTIVVKGKALPDTGPVEEKKLLYNTIRGKIVNEEGEPVPGVTIMIKGTQFGAVSDNNGEFTLERVESNSVLLLTSTNIETLEYHITGKVSLNISVKKRINKLDEVQIQAYGTTTRRTSTGNITTVKAEDIAKQPVDNPLYALIARVPGLIVTQTSGMPGAPVKIQLRGQNSLVGASSEPLIVIDGIPYNNNIPGVNSTDGNMNLSALSFVNPSDIASIDVLKDGDATAIYGSRGANGVLIITTKKGKVGSTRVDVSFSTGFSEVSKKLDLMNTQQFLETRKEGYINDGRPLPTNPDDTNYDLTVWDQNRYTDWQSELLGGTAGTMNAQASISGGTHTMQYLLSGTYNKLGYVFPGKAKFETATGHFNISGNSMNNKFRAVLTGSYASNNSTPPADFTYLAMTLAPNAPALYTADGDINWGPNPLTGVATWQNPLIALLKRQNSQTKALTANIDLSYRITPSLMLKTSMGFTDVRLESYMPTPISSYDPTASATVTGSADFSNNSARTSTIEPQVLYNTYIGDGRLEALAGATLQTNNIESQQIAAHGYTDDALLRSLAFASITFPRNTNSEYKYAGVFARFMYNWKEKYIVNINGRRDGSSRFGPGRQYGNFGSVGAAWVFTNEAFIQKAVPFMSFGKLRFSYGVSGNDGIGDYSYLELYEPLFASSYQGVRPIMTMGAINENYRWENVYKAEIGIDAGFFKDRVIIGASFWRNRSSNQLGQLILPATTGSFSIIINQPAKIQNSGVELTLVTANIKGKDFTWNTSANISFANNKLLSVPEEMMQYYYYDYDPIGKPFAGVLFLYDHRGVNPATGLYVFADKDGKTTSSAWDAYARSKMVRTAPYFYGGISNNFSYKGLSLDIFVQFTKQNGRSTYYDFDFGMPGAGLNQPVQRMARWRQPGDVSDVMRFSSQGNQATYESFLKGSNSDAAWIDASFIRIKNIALSYSLPVKWKEKLKLQNLRIYVQAQNLLTFTDYIGADPEAQQVLSLPPLRTINTGIQIGF